MSVFYNFSLVNDSDVDVLVDKTDTPYTELLPKASDYGVSVIKFTLPNEAETFRILDGRYTVTLVAPVPLFTVTQFNFTLSLPTRDVFKIRCVADFIECLNRTLIAAHNGLIRSISTTLGTLPTNPVPIQNPALTVTADFTTTQVQTLTFSSIPKGARMSLLECGFRIRTPNDGGNTAAPNLDVWLVSPAGVSMALTGNRRLSFTDTSGAFYTFSDAVLTQNTSPFDVLEPLSQPLEPYSKLLTNNESTAASTGDWKMVFRYSTVYQTAAVPSMCRKFTLDARIQYIISPLYSTNATSVTSLTASQFPYVPPAFSFDTSTKTISMVLQDRTPLSGYSLVMSPHLFNVMPFPGTLVDVPNPTPLSGFLISIPQSAYIANTNPPLPDTFDGTLYKASVYPAPNPNESYKLLDISTVIITTNLSTHAEQEATTNQRILMSLDVSGSDYFSNLYQFSSTNITTRTYQILDNGPLTRIGVSVFFKYRTTGEVVQALLPPHTTFAMLLKFIPTGMFA
jgi:hypothetical protein